MLNIKTIILERNNKLSRSLFLSKLNDHSFITKDVPSNFINKPLHDLLLLNLFDYYGETIDNVFRVRENFIFYKKQTDIEIIKISLFLTKPTQRFNKLVKYPETLNHFNKLIRLLDNKKCNFRAAIINLLNSIITLSDQKFLIEVDFNINCNNNFYYIALENNEKLFNFSITINTEFLN